MPAKLSIGDFSRMTHLSVKVLRRYHELGLLEPSGVDQSTGYRSYDLSQVPAAQVIRRFRDLDMPVEHIKAILKADDVDHRNALIVAHLKQMESTLERTQSVVASLRSLLDGSPTPITVEYRSVSAVHVAAITRIVCLPDIEPWWSNSFAKIYRVLRDQGVSPAAPSGGLYPTELYTDEVGEVTLFVPVVGQLAPVDDVFLRELPAAELAVAVHRGALREADRTYAPLGTHVVERAIAVSGPIRESYLVTSDDVGDESQLVTEIAWPIFRTSPGA
ncbi:MAG: MerR family transcriptional regulator [Candidatus Cybelea sp.]